MIQTIETSIEMVTLAEPIVNNVRPPIRNEHVLYLLQQGWKFIKPTDIIKEGDRYAYVSHLPQQGGRTGQCTFSIGRTPEQHTEMGTDPFWVLRKTNTTPKGNKIVI